MPYNSEMPSRAVVCRSKEGQGCVLYWVGQDLLIEIKDAGLRDLGDLGLDDAPVGISIWEGRYVAYRSGNPMEADYGFETACEGKFRPLTLDEWCLLQEGPPWNEDDWKVKGLPADG